MTDSKMKSQKFGCKVTFYRYTESVSCSKSRYELIKKGCVDGGE
jgi:hypothetical protein